MRQLTVTSSEEGRRIDKYILKYLNTAPSSFVYKLLRKKNVKLNSKRANGEEVLKKGDVVEIYLSETAFENFRKEDTKDTPLGIKGNIDIIYEDENVLFVNKKAGILTQRDKSGDPSLNDNILFYLKDSIEPSFKPSVCNRLDRNTSGIVTAGKNLEALRELSCIFADKKAEKIYLALVWGVLKSPSVLELYHTKDKNNKVRVTKEKREGASFVRTYFEPIHINEEENITLLRLRLDTGKSHQIRASLSHISHPIIGDRKYSREDINQKYRKLFGLKDQFLHAYNLSFRTEGKLSYLNDKVFKAPLPKQLENIVKYFNINIE